MSDAEIKELEAWIAEYVFGLITHPIFKAFYCQKDNHDVALNKDQCRYATDSAAAMEVFKKCHEITSTITGKRDENYYCGGRIEPDQQNQYEVAPTLELAICLFAKQLFTK